MAPRSRVRPGATACTTSRSRSPDAPGPHAPRSDRHRRKIVPQRHVLREIFLRDPPLDVELPVLHAADVAVDDAAMVFLADDLVALRMRKRVLHLHALERLQHALDVIALLVA